MTGLFKNGSGCTEVVGSNSFQGDSLACHCACNHESPGLDPVGDYVVLDSFEVPDSLNDDPASACTGDLGAHLHEEVSKVYDFRFTRSGVNNCGSPGQRGSHH